MIGIISRTSVSIVTIISQIFLLLFYNTKKPFQKKAKHKKYLKKLYTHHILLKCFKVSYKAHPGKSEEEEG